MNTLVPWVEQISSDHPGLIARDATGNLYVEDAPAIRVFAPSGQLTQQWNVTRESDGSFEDILGFDVLPDSTVIVAQSHGTGEESLYILSERDAVEPMDHERIG